MTAAVTPDRVMGIDPSLKRTGVCLPSGQTQRIATGEASRGDRRLYLLQKEFRYYLRSSTVALAVLEIPGQFRSGDAALAAGMSQGVVRAALVEYAIPTAYIHLTALKMFACGRGDADKPALIAAANRHREGLPPIVDDNEADAWWLWQMGRWHLGARDLDPAQDEWLNPHLIRDAKTRDGKGTKWPGIRVAVVRRPRSTPPGHSPAKKSG